MSLIPWWKNKYLAWKIIILDEIFIFLAEKMVESTKMQSIDFL